LWRVARTSGKQATDERGLTRISPSSLRLHGLKECLVLDDLNTRRSVREKTKDDRGARRAEAGEAVLRHERLGFIVKKKMKATSQDPEVLGGELVFTGTRVPVKSLFDHLEGGDSIEDFLEGFPSVRREQVMTVLEESREHALAVH